MSDENHDGGKSSLTETEAVEEWIDEWADSHLPSPETAEPREDFAAEADACIVAGSEAGFTRDQIEAATEGDVESYLRRSHNAAAEFYGRQVRPE